MLLSPASEPSVLPLIGTILLCCSLAGLLVSGAIIASGIRMNSTNPMGGTDHSVASAKRLWIGMGLFALLLTVSCGGTGVVMLLMQ